MTSYEKSNSILEVALKRFSSSYSHDFLSSDTTIKDREKNAQKLVNYLCDKFKNHIAMLLSQTNVKITLQGTVNLSRKYTADI